MSRSLSLSVSDDTIHWTEREGGVSECTAATPRVHPNMCRRRCAAGSWGLCPCFPGVGRCFSGVNVSSFISEERTKLRVAAQCVQPGADTSAKKTTHTALHGSWRRVWGALCVCAVNQSIKILTKPHTHAQKPHTGKEKPIPAPPHTLRVLFAEFVVCAMYMCTSRTTYYMIR